MRLRYKLSGDTEGMISKSEIYKGQVVWYGRLDLTSIYNRTKNFVFSIRAQVSSLGYKLEFDGRAIDVPMYYYGFVGESFFKDRHSLLLAWNSDISYLISEIQKLSESTKKFYAAGRYAFDAVTRGYKEISFPEPTNYCELLEGNCKKFCFYSNTRSIPGLELPTTIFSINIKMNSLGSLIVRGRPNSQLGYCSKRDYGENIFNSAF